MKTSLRDRNFVSIFARAIGLGLVGLMSVVLTGCNLSFTMVDGYVFDRTGEIAEATGQGTFSPSITAIEIENKFGNVSIEATDGDATWQHDAKVWADTKELAAKLATGMIVQPETVGKTLKLIVTVPGASPEFNGLESNLTFKVPAEMITKLVNGHGNVSVSKLSGNVELNNEHGDVNVKELFGNLVANTAHGNLMANHIDSANLTVRHGRTTIESASGDVNFTSAHGNVIGHYLAGNVTGRNSHGSTEITTSGEDVSVSASHGDIQVLVESDAFKTIELETSHSSIKLQLPPNSRPNIDMNTTHGQASSTVDSVASGPQYVKLRNSHGNINVSPLSSGTGQ